jgi:putative transposase
MSGLARGLYPTYKERLLRYRRVKREGATYFFTVVTHRRRPLFNNRQTVDWLQAAIQATRSRHPFEVDAQVILPDHLHCLWTLPAADANYSTRWRLIKEAFTRTYIKHCGIPEPEGIDRNRGEQAVWQRRFWEHTISDESDFAKHLDYIHLNPVQHGLVRSPGDWPYSTYQSCVDQGIYEAGWGADTLPELPDRARLQAGEPL